MAVTKWDLLTEDERRALENTPFEGECYYCQTPLKTEAEFAQHFIVPNTQYRNLGWCPVNAGRPS